MNGRDSVLFSAQSREWGTPRWLYNQLHKEFDFTLDPCTTEENPLGTPRFYTKETDGLAHSWAGERVFCNPPYTTENACGAGCVRKRCAKRGYHHYDFWAGSAEFLAHATAVETAPEIAVFLLPSRTDVDWFHEYVYDEERKLWRPGVDPRFLRGRLQFEGAPAPAPFPSVVVVMDPMKRPCSSNGRAAA